MVPNVDPADILAKLDNVNTARRQGKLGAREEMLELAHSLVSSLESPSEFVSRITWMEPARSACVRSAVDLDLFELLSQQSHSGKGVSADQLAQSTQADRTLLTRVLKHLNATHVIAETGNDAYCATTLSTALTEPKFRDGIVFGYDIIGPSFLQIPEFFSSTKYTNPLNPVAGPFQFAHKTEQHFFPWLDKSPKYLSAFANYMSGYHASKLPWMDARFYPVQQNLSDVEESKPLLVDIGGGIGHDIKAFQARFPTLQGKLILQDRPEVIEQAKHHGVVEKGIELQAHDFFTEQPVTNARAYYLHSVLHDWDDSSCIKILQNLIPALGPDSKILINECIMPPEGAEWHVTSLDMVMMALVSVQERTEADFKRLIESAGLKIRKVWSVDQSTESLIEVTL